MAHRRHFETQDIENATVVRLVDPKLSETLVVNELQDELLEFLDQTQPRRLVIDFQTVSLCSTAVINGLLRAKKRLVADGGQLRLCGMSTNVREAYRLLNLDGTVFDIREDVPEAVHSFHGD